MSTTSVHGLTKRFGRRILFTDLTFVFAPRTRYVINGPSGCGKTTLLNILAGYLCADAGRVDVPASIGYVFQDELIFSSLTVRQNLYVRLSGLHADLTHANRMICDALDRANIADLIDRPVSHLSGGERQRVQLAGVLLAEPQLVLMDEPTVRLDRENQVEIAAAVVDLFAASTVIVVSHDERTPLRDGATCLRLENGALL